MEQTDTRSLTRNTVTVVQHRNGHGHARIHTFGPGHADWHAKRPWTLHADADTAARADRCDTADVPDSTYVNTNTDTCRCRHRHGHRDAATSRRAADYSRIAAAQETHSYTQT